jgi:hypothetical protein
LCGALIDHKFAFRDDRHLAILSQPDDIHRDAAGTEEGELALGRLGKKNLGDGVASGKVDQRFGGVFSFEHASFDVEFAGELEVLFESDGIGRRHNADGETIGFEIIRDAASAAD